MYNRYISSHFDKSKLTTQCCFKATCTLTTATAKSYLRKNTVKQILQGTMIHVEWRLKFVLFNALTIFRIHLDMI